MAISPERGRKRRQRRRPSVGRPRYAPSEESRRFVVAMARDGKPEADIANVVGIDPKTLRRHYRAELDTSFVLANMAVSQTLLQSATGGGGEDGWKQANITAAIWWDKTRNGKHEPWRELSLSEVVSSADGVGIVIRGGLPEL